MGKSSFDINLNININVNLDKVLELMNAASAAWNAMQGTRGEAAPEPEQAAGQEPEQGQGQEQELGQELGQEQPAEAPTEQDLRDAIRRTRARIEGEDYENNTDSEGYARYHKALSSWFRRIAETVGGTSKPIQLPPEKRAAFIRECDNTVLSDAGELEIRQEF